MAEKKYDVDGIIFDLGSTLVEYANSPWDEINEKCISAGYKFLKTEGYKLPPIEEFTEIQKSVRLKYSENAEKTLAEWSLTVALNEFTDELHLNGSHEMIKAFYDAWYKPIADQITIFDDTHTVLETLKAKDKKIGLVSNTIFPRDFHYADLEKFDLHKYLDFEIYSSSFGWRKPDERIYKEAVSKINLPVDKLLFVGDRYLEDVKGPQDFGMKAILKFVENREYPDPMPENLVVIKTLSELIDYLI